MAGRNPHYGCSEYTPFKVKYFAAILGMHLRIVKKIFDNPKKDWVDRYYRFFDLTAGPGVLKNKLQSPIITHELIGNSCLDRDVYFIERNRDFCERLLIALGEEVQEDQDLENTQCQG